jgi:hypothetical protein
MKPITILAGFLGSSIFMFGLLKFFDPFKTWYHTQIFTSGLGVTAYWMGIIGELVVGGLLLLTAIRNPVFPVAKYIPLIGICASLLLVILMATGIYVHLHPSVPATVLPLKIKPPYIPGFFLLAGLIHIRLLLRQIR